MNDLIKSLKNIKNGTKETYQEVIYNYSKKEVLKELKEAGIDKDEISTDDYEELLKEKIQQSTSFSKGAMVATGGFLFLELLG